MNLRLFDPRQNDCNSTIAEEPTVRKSLTVATGLNLEF